MPLYRRSPFLDFLNSQQKRPVNQGPNPLLWNLIFGYDYADNMNNPPFSPRPLQMGPPAAPQQFQMQGIPVAPAPQQFQMQGIPVAPAPPPSRPAPTLTRKPTRE